MNLIFCYHIVYTYSLRDWSLIRGRGGATKRENRRSETFCAPPPQDRVKLCAPPPHFKGLKLFAPPHHYG